MPKRSSAAAPGAGGGIRRIEAGEMRLLLRPGRRFPAGWYIAKMENGEWMGADTHFGAVPRRFEGTFKEVIEWLIPPTGQVRNITRERETSWKAAVSGIVPVRIEGAEVKEWKWDWPEVQGLDGTPVSGRDAAFLSRSRARGGQAVGARIAAEASERDERILALFRDGKTYREIADDVGLTEGTISTRLKRMREADPDIGFGERQHDKEEIAALDEKVLACLRSGMTQAQTARELGENLKRVAHRVAAMRERGVPVPDSYNDRMQAERTGRSREAYRLRKSGMSCREIGEAMGCAESTARKLVRAYKESGGGDEE